MQGQIGYSRWVNIQFRDEGKCLLILVITILDGNQPLRDNNGDGLIFCKTMPSQGVSSTVVRATSVLDAVIQAQMFGEDFVLPGRVQALLVKLSKAFVVREDCELAMLEVGTPLLYYDDNHHVLLFISGESKIGRAHV